MLQAHIRVTLKAGVNDPQGLAVRGGLHQLGFTLVEEVRLGKYLVVTLDTSDEAEARRQVSEMCERLLANPLIEAYSFELSDASSPSFLPKDSPSPLVPDAEGTGG